MIGRSEIVELLEVYLEAAKNNRFEHIAISMVGHPNFGTFDHAGDIALEELQRDALAILDAKLKKSIDNWSFPPQDPSLDASYVRYNLASGPLGFDFLIWIIDAEMTRIREGAPAPLKIWFWNGHDNIDDERRAMWLERVFRPTLEFIGAVEDPAALHGRCKEMYLPRDIVAASFKGEPVPMLKTGAEWTGPPNPVTITLREVNYGLKRNSNYEAWVQFAKMLQSQGETVIVVRDTAKAMEPIDGVLTSPLASRKLDVRLALYNAAKANLFVGNGPGGLAIFGTRPWLSFIAPVDGSEDEVCNRADFWEQRNGIPIGAQFPWSGPDQRLIWRSDTYENIVEAWNETVAAIAA